MPVKVEREDQLGALQREGRLREINYNPVESAARLARAEPFLDSVAGDLGLRSGGQEDKMRHAQTIDAWKHLKRTGVRPFTVVNCMPWSIEVTCGVFRHFVKKADTRKGEEFHAKTFGIHDCRTDQRDLGDGKVSPMILLPIEIAGEFMDKYVGKEGELDEDDEGNKINNKPGGAFCYEGDVNDPPANFGELVAEAKQRMADWFWNQYKAGEGAWERYKHDPIHITERMKDAAHFLFNVGRIPSLPDWIAATRADSGVKDCPNCANQIKKKAKQCSHCFAVLNDDGSFERQGGAGIVRPATPEPPPTPPESRIDRSLLTHEPEASDPTAGKSDMDVLNTPDDQLPAPKAARPNKPPVAKKD